MTDESFVYRTEVNERANVARNSKNRALKGGKCTLPSDSMSHWAKKRENGDVIVMAPNRPILYDDFKELSEEMQKEYLQGLIDNYGGTTERIAKMWNISEAKVKFHRQYLGVKSIGLNTAEDFGIVDGMVWTDFLCRGDFLKEPMKYEELRKLTKNEQRSYLIFCNKDLDGSPTEIANMLGINNVYCRSMMKKLGIQMHDRAYRYSHKLWEEWLQKYDAHCGVHQTDETSYDYPNIEPSIPISSDNPTITDTSKIEDTEQKPIEIREADIPYLNLIMTVKDYEQIFDILKTLPRAQSGTITFTFGEESEKIET